MRIWPGNQFRIYAPLSRFDRPFRYLAPAGPSSLAVAPSSGGAPGEVRIEVYGTPSYLGDGPIAGDGAGVLTGILISIGGAAAVLYDTTIPRIVVDGGHAEGASVPWTVQALGYSASGLPGTGRPGTILSGSVQAAVTPPAAFIGLVDGATGYGLVVNGVGIAVPAPAA